MYEIYVKRMWTMMVQIEIHVTTKNMATQGYTEAMIFDWLKRTIDKSPSLRQS